MQHQQELPADEGVHRLQRVLLVVLVTFDSETVVVTEVHGEEVVRHVGHAVPDDKGCGQPVPDRKKKQIHENIHHLHVGDLKQDKKDKWVKYNFIRIKE